MAHPAKEARDRAQAAWPGAVVVERRRNSIKHQHPTDPNKFMLDVGIGPMHFGPLEDQEINSAWQPGVAPWNFQMTLAGYNAFALANFASGQIVKYVHPESGESIAFQPQQLQYTNDLNQIQAVANPQSVNAVVQDEDVLFWQGAFGPGMDIRWQAQTARLDKRLIVDQASRWPIPQQFILDGGNPVARLQFIFRVSNGIDIYVNGVLWDRAPSNPVDTTGYVEFRLSSTGETVWWFNLPRSFGAPVEDQEPDELLGTFRLRRTGPNLFVEHRIPISWLQAANYPIEIDVTIDEIVGASSDDCFAGLSSSEFNSGSIQNLVGEFTSGFYDYRSGFRFQTVNVSQAATVDVAYITLKSNVLFTPIPATFIDGDDTDDAATFIDLANYTGRARTTAVTSWTPAAWVVGTVYNSPSIVAVIQEIVDRPGWAANNALALFWRDADGWAGGAGRIAAVSWNSDTANAPKLHIEYSAAAAGQPFMKRTQGIPTGPGSRDRPGRWN